MQEEGIRFEEIGKDDTAHAEQSSALFKQPIRGAYKNLHAELKARCAPENFMNPYEPDKVSMANELYSLVLSANENDDATLKALRLKAMELLGVRFSTEELYKKLTDACNPKNFTGENYNKERLDLANRLYQAVLMNADNIIALEEVEVEASELIREYSNTSKFGDGIIQHNQVEYEENWKAYLIYVIICFIFLCIGIIYLCIRIYR